MFKPRTVRNFQLKNIYQFSEILNTEFKIRKIVIPLGWEGILEFEVNCIIEGLFSFWKGRNIVSIMHTSGWKRIPRKMSKDIQMNI